MCVDLTVGEVHPPGGHHSVTGLLSPLLLAVAAVLLAIIIVCTHIKEAYLARAKRRLEAKRSKSGGGGELDSQTRGDNTKDALGGGGSELASEAAVKSAMKKSATQQRFDEIMRDPDEEDTSRWQTAAKMTQIVANKSTPYDLNKQAEFVFDNEALERDYDDLSYPRRIENQYNSGMDQEQDPRDQHHRYNNHHHQGNRHAHFSHRPSHEVRTLESLSHLLNDKPWTSRRN